MARSQLSILASPELVKRVKERAAEKSLTVTAYVLKLVGADLDGAERTLLTARRAVDRAVETLRSMS